MNHALSALRKVAKDELSQGACEFFYDEAPLATPRLS